MSRLNGFGIGFCIYMGVLTTVAHADNIFLRLGSFRAYGLSKDGTTVTGAAPYTTYRSRAAILTSAGTRALTGGPEGSFARTISANRQVIIGDNGSGKPAYWQNLGFMQLLPLLPGDTFGQALGVSADGTTIVGSSGAHAVKWINGILSLLPATSDPNLGFVARNISADKSTIVGNSYPLIGIGGEQPCTWTGSDIRILPVSSGSVPRESGYLIDSSEHGGTVLGTIYHFELNIFQNHYWRQTPELWGVEAWHPYNYYPGTVQPVARAAGWSRDLQIVFGSNVVYDPYSPATGFYSDVGAMFVSTVLPNKRPWLVTEVLSFRGLFNSIQGWHLDHAVAISGDGQTAVGDGISPEGNQESWLIHLDPEAANVNVPVDAQRHSLFVGGSVIPATVNVFPGANAGGDIVELSGPPSVVLPSSVFIPATHTGTPISIFTHGVPGQTNITITSHVAGSNRTGQGQFSLMAANLIEIRPQQTIVSQNSSMTATVRFDGAAQPGGSKVVLTSDSTAVVVPSSVTIPYDQWYAQFPITVKSVSTITIVNLSATYNGKTVTVPIVVVP